GANSLRAVLLHELVADEAEEVGLADPRVDPARPQVQVLDPDRLAVVRIADVAARVESEQNLVSALDCVVGILERVEDRRSLRETGEKGRLHERELAGVPRKVRLRCGLDAVRMAAVIDGVY